MRAPHWLERTKYYLCGKHGSPLLVKLHVSMQRKNDSEQVERGRGRAELLGSMALLSASDTPGQDVCGIERIVNAVLQEY